MRLKYYPANLGDIVYIQKSNDDLEGAYIIELVREIPFGETEVMEYFILHGYVNDETVILQKSNYLTNVNNLTEIFLWIKKVGETYEMIAEVLTSETNVIEWNTESNVEFNKITNIPILGIDDTIGDEFISETGSMSTAFPMEYIKIKNGIFDHLNISSCVTEPYSTVIPDWDYCTNFDCDFNDNVNGGNTDILLSQLAYIKVKRRKSTDFTWVTLYEKEVTSIVDLDIIYNDYYNKSGETYYYAIVPVLTDGTEGDYITDDVETNYNYLFVSDVDQTFKMISNVSFNSSQIRLLGKHQALSGKHPILIANGEQNSSEGSISGSLLGYDFDDDRTVNRDDANSQMDDFMSFLTNGKSKIAKDWNGKIKLIQVDTSSIPTTTKMPSGINNVTFNWIEQGDYNDEDDLRNNGLIE